MCVLYVSAVVCLCGGGDGVVMVTGAQMCQKALVAPLYVLLCIRYRKCGVVFGLPASDRPRRQWKPTGGNSDSGYDITGSEDTPNSIYLISGVASCVHQLAASSRQPVEPVGLATTPLVISTLPTLTFSSLNRTTQTHKTVRICISCLSSIGVAVVNIPWGGFYSNTVTCEVLYACPVHCAQLFYLPACLPATLILSSA